MKKSKQDEEENNSISPTKISVPANQPILATSPTYILTNKNTANKNYLVIYDKQLEKFEIPYDITDIIIDALWFEIEEKFLLLTEKQIFSYEPNLQQMEIIECVKPEEKKFFKSFTLDHSQSVLFIAYNEWEAKYIEKWQHNLQDGFWKNLGKYPVNLTCNECIEKILAFNKNGVSKIAMTIYNSLFNEWRLETCYEEHSESEKKIRLPGSDADLNYQVMIVETNSTGINMVINSLRSKSIIVIDTEYEKIDWNYGYPISAMAQFGRRNLIIRTAKEMDILRLS